MIDAPTARPIVKYAGGKRRLVPELSRRAPSTYGTYYEPFVGGGALFFALRPARAVLSDVNAPLVATYRAIAGDVEGVIAELSALAERHSSAAYAATRADWNGTPDLAPHVRAAMFLYLNKSCFNGLWRVNRRGEFNVPMGRYANPTICDPEALRAAATALAAAELIAADFRSIVPEPGDFVYCDPPYVPISRTSSFTAYGPDKFDDRDQRDLAQWARALVDRGVHVVLSNSNSDFVRELYADRAFVIERVEAARAINSKGSARGKVGELIITGRAR